MFHYFKGTDARQVPEAAGMTLPMVLLLLSCPARHGGFARLVHTGLLCRQATLSHESRRQLFNADGLRTSACSPELATLAMVPTPP